MKENREFDILENADDSEVELLAEVSVLTGKEKKRMKKMSKDKLNKSFGENKMGDEVSGVERYKRPKWYSFAAVAACLVLICGIVGTTVFLGKHGKPVIDDPMSGTEFDAEATIEGLIEKFYEISLIHYGGGVEIDKSGATMTYTNEFGEKTYYRVTDERFSTVREVKDYFAQYLAEPYSNIFKMNLAEPNCLFREDVQSGELYYFPYGEPDKNASNIKLKKGSDGKVHFDIKPTEDKDILYYFEYSYDFSVPAETQGEDCTLYGRLVRDDGKWKLSWLAPVRPEDEDDWDDWDELTCVDCAAAHIALSKLDEYDSISMGGEVDIDENDTKEFKITDSSGNTFGKTYYRVTDKRFKKLADVKAYFEESFSKAFIEKNSFLWEGDAPVFREEGGKLYYVLAGGTKLLEFSDADYAIRPDGTMEVESWNRAPFVYNQNNSNYIRVICVKENGRWKVDSYENFDPWEEEEEEEDDEYEVLSDEEYDELAEKAIRTRQDLYEIVYGNPFETDANDIITVDTVGGPQKYIRVITDRFSCVDDIIDYIEDNCTGDYEDINKIVVASGDYPRYADRNAKLYMLLPDEDYDYVADIPEEYEVTEKTAYSFTVHVKKTDGYEDDFYVIKSGDKWMLRDRDI